MARFLNVLALREILVRMFTDVRWCALLTNTVSTQPIQLQSGRWHFSNPIWLSDAYLWQIMKGEQLLKNWNDPVERSEPFKVLRCGRQVRGNQASTRFSEGSSSTANDIRERESIKSKKLSTIWYEDKQTKQNIKSNKTQLIHFSVVKASGYKTGLKLNVASYAHNWSPLSECLISIFPFLPCLTPIIRWITYFSFIPAPLQDTDTIMTCFYKFIGMFSQDSF